MLSLKKDHIHVSNPDVEKTVEFYTKVLGGKVAKEMVIGTRKMIDVDIDGITIRISAGTGADQNWKGPSVGLHHFGFNTTNLEKTLAELKTHKGVEVVFGPSQSPTGTKYVFVKGPDGTLFEIMEPPKKP